MRGHRDGVWLVELAALGDPALVPNATLAALGLTVPARRPALDGLAAQLAGWDALLIVDNCEHLVTAAALMAERLLGGCPRLRILATSREPLRASGEVTWRVPSLELPDRRPSRVRGRAVVLRARPRRPDQLRVERRERRGGGHDLPPARRDAAGA